MTPPAKKSERGRLPDGWGLVMLLADSAAVSEGKIFMLGGGWSLVSASTPSFAVVVKIEVPWNAANEPHRLALELVNDDATPVMVHTAGEEVAVEGAGSFEVGRPPGVKPGTALDLPIVFNFQSLSLQPGRRYVWRLSIDGRDDLTRELVFSTRPAPKV